MVGYGGISQLDHDLGWRQGYQVSFYRLDRKHDDMTDIIQLISTYPENINAVYRLKQETLIPDGYNASGFQIPSPIIRTRAWHGRAPGVRRIISLHTA